MISFYETDPAVTEVPGTSEVFRRLHAHGIKAALNTGFSRDIAQVLIDRFGWERDGLIDASVASDEVERGRPHPFMIHRLMQRLGIDDPARVAKVGDDAGGSPRGASRRLRPGNYRRHGRSERDD